MKVSIQRVVPHPSYNPALLDFDLAVLELTRPLPLGKYIQAICLPLAIHKFPVGKRCMISGWGSIQEGNSRCPSVTTECKVGLIQGPETPEEHLWQGSLSLDSREQYFWKKISFYLLG